jgi:hypothetical protein
MPTTFVRAIYIPQCAITGADRGHHGYHGLLQRAWCCASREGTCGGREPHALDADLVLL